MQKLRSIYKLISALIAGIAIPFLFHSCSSDSVPEPADCTVNPVEIQSVSATEASCGLQDGSITINASGGSGEYQYSIDGESFQTGNTFDQLLAGNYSVTVRDANECSVTSDVMVESQVDMTIEVSQTVDAGCGSQEGELSIIVAGGQSPYQYRTEGGTYQDDSNLSGIPAGSITVFARDANGCEISAITEVEAGTSLEESVMPILETNCAISGCHDGNGSLIDWSDKENVINNAENIKTRTGNGSMPPGGRSITDDEIQTIACWVDDGAKDN